MPKPPKISLKAIVAASDPARRAAGMAAPRGPLKERAKQLSVYLEPAVYDQLRDIAHAERTKMHPLMLEALDLLFSHRGARSIRDIEERETID